MVKVPVSGQRKGGGGGVVEQMEQSKAVTAEERLIVARYAAEIGRNDTD